MNNSIRKVAPWVIGAVVLIGLFVAYLCNNSYNGPMNDNDQLRVHVLDVGQADSIILELPNGKVMLIDTATSESVKQITSYIDRLSIKKIDYLVATHPHSDHIGGLSGVISRYEIGQIILPKVNSIEDFGIISSETPIFWVLGATQLHNDDGLSIELLSPNRETYKDENNGSVVVKITYGERSFLFMGDAGEVVERELMAFRYNIDADVIKIAHHGSNSATSKEFLEMVSPDYAVITLAKNTSESFPHEEVITRIREAGATLYRTDTDGTIIFTCDGTNITTVTEK